jgi:fructose-1,6-bisphosphatase/inositol monophosphatase family enzyme
LLVEEAGGRATDILGGELRFNRERPRVQGILAGAPLAWERALREVAPLGITRSTP